MSEEFVKFDTTVVQVRSVLNFMYALGYTLDRNAKSGRFVTELEGLQGNRYLSIQSAVKMHNLHISDWEGEQVGDVLIVFPKSTRMQYGFTAIGVTLARASKLVEKAKFSVNRHGNIVTQGIMIKPLNLTVAQMVNA